MKYLLHLSLILLVYLSACAHKVPANSWMLGFTPEQVRNYVLGKPGSSEQWDRSSGASREICFDATSGYTTHYYFEDNRLVNTVVEVFGVHKEDIDNQYHDALYKRVGVNDWIDTTKGSEVSIHREYDGSYTRVKIGFKP